MQRRNPRTSAASSGSTHIQATGLRDAAGAPIWGGECIGCARWRGSSIRRSVWHRLGFILSVTIIAVAAVVLYRKLHDINFAKVLTAMATVEYRDVAIGRAVRRLRLLHADVLRSVCAAHDRPQRRALPCRCARRLHLLFGRPQRRRQRVHRRRGALSHLFRLGARCHRGRQDLLHRRPDVLARQYHRARPRLRLASGSGVGDRSAAGVVQPRRSASSR